jgi:CBS domain-containing protein
MSPTTKPLLALTAADLMSRSVVTIPEAMSLQAAARLLSRAQITGAPVVNAEGRCVGVLSATDFVCWAKRGGAATRPGHPSPGCFYTGWEVSDVAALPEDEVRLYMTPDPVPVPPDAPIGVLARAMVDAHIHRLIVLGEGGRPVGVISSMDILAAVAASVVRSGPAAVPR